jgi:hypothetical protein
MAGPLADPADGQSTPVWRLFAWASIALAIAATLLFVVLLLVT